MAPNWIFPANCAATKIAIVRHVNVVSGAQKAKYKLLAQNKIESGKLEIQKWKYLNDSLITSNRYVELKIIVEIFLKVKIRNIFLCNASLAVKFSLPSRLAKNNNRFMFTRTFLFRFLPKKSLMCFTGASVVAEEYYHSTSFLGGVYFQSRFLSFE